MSTRKQLPIDEWQQWLQTFTSGNAGRKVAIAAEGMTLVENKAFRDLEYDPVGKGNDLVITVGYGDETYWHTVNAPVEIYEHQENNGQVSTLEILDQNGKAVFLRFLVVG
jgi:hypothetical protein